jgi:hypothetical protein
MEDECYAAPVEAEDSNENSLANKKSLFVLPAGNSESVKWNNPSESPIWNYGNITANSSSQIRNRHWPMGRIQCQPPIFSRRSDPVITGLQANIRLSLLENLSGNRSTLHQSPIFPVSNDGLSSKDLCNFPQYWNAGVQR